MRTRLIVIKPLAPPKPPEQMEAEDWRKLAEREYDQEIAPVLRRAEIDPAAEPDDPS
jgi:hypothetical protein